MKIQTNVQQVERTGTGSENTFKIKTTAKAFSILSSGIYSDPITAVIRELSCNAYDAHVDAGKKDEPFELHLPNALEPWFSVKDNGVGLSDEDVRSLYTTYFESTKTNSNDVIGALGLGSKSPFSYSSAFEVIVRHNGTRRVYSVFLNEDEVPTIALMNTIKTDETNGLEVKLTVKPSDFRDFTNKTAHILRYFPVKPAIKGVARFEFEPLPKEHHEDEHCIISNDVDYHNRGVIAIQGYVPYRVDNDKIYQYLEDADKAFINRCQVALKFSIGELEVAASREEIRYDARSVKNLVAKIQLARKAMLVTYDKEIEALTKNAKKWDAYWLIAKKFSNSDHIKSISKGYTWSSKIVDQWIKDTYLSVPFVNCYTFDGFKSGSRRALSEGRFASATTGRLQMAPIQYYQKVILNDVPARAHLRLNDAIEGLAKKHPELFHSKYSQRAVMITPVNLKTLQKRHPKTKKFDYEGDLKKLLANFGNPEVIKLSEISEDVAVAKSGRKGSTGLVYMKFESGGDVRSRMRPVFTHCKDKKAITATTTKVYVGYDSIAKKIMLRDNKTILEWSHSTAEDLFNVIISIHNSLTGEKLNLDHIFGLPKRTLKAIEDDKTWVNLFDLAEKAMTGFLDAYHFIQDKNATTSQYELKTLALRHDFIDHCKKLDTDSVLREELLEFAEKNSKIQALLGKVSEHTLGRFNTLATYLKITLPTHKNQTLFNSSRLAATYPLLKYVGMSSTPMKDVMEYVKLIDETS